MFTVSVYGYDECLLSGYMDMANVYCQGICIRPMFTVSVYVYDQCLLSGYMDMTNVYCQGIWI